MTVADLIEKLREMPQDAEVRLRNWSRSGNYEELKAARYSEGL